MPSVPVRLAALLVACALALAAACGSDEPKTFDEDGFAITFEYPGDFERTTDVNTDREVGQAEESVALAMSEDNAIFVQRYGLNRPVTPGDAEAVKAELDRDFSELYRAHLRDVYSYSYYRVGNHHDAEDLTEQAFLQAYRHFERARRESNGRPLRPWLIRIAHNLASNYHRDRARRPEANIEAIEPP